MLDSLDTLIAFAVVMSILSLLVTIITQMISSALALRGTNLANALALTFQTVDPKIGEQAHALAEHILTDPLLSDSTFKTKTRKPSDPEIQGRARDHARTGDAVESLKTQVQALRDDIAKTNSTPRQNQLEAEIQQRQTQLDAAQTEFEAAEEALLPHEAALESKLRKSPVASWWPSGWTYASAVRPDEVYRVLREISTLDPAEAAHRGVARSLTRTAAQLLEALKIPTTTKQEAQNRIQDALKLGDALPEPLRQTILQSFTGLAGSVTQAAGQSYDRFERWFSSSQDRAQQWFAAHTRRITLIGACIVAFGLQVDTLEIYHTLSTKADV
ncbi:MAG TPA: hypothetical protein VEO95_03735, partial [Chthoniobacteraceae bacterium]|nr:hypothetical protein [Chthoniobacteraceae bacterium]